MTGIEARSSSMPTGAKRGCIDQDAACLMPPDVARQVISIEHLKAC